MNLVCFCSTVRPFSSMNHFPIYSNSNDGTDKNKRIMERIKWRQQSVVTRRMEVAYGPDERAIRFPSSAKNIWRDTYRRDPPPPAHGSNKEAGRSSSGRGTKRKKQSSHRSEGAGGGGGAPGGSSRNVRRRPARKRNERA